MSREQGPRFAGMRPAAIAAGCRQTGRYFAEIASKEAA
jgi:hypothetical protein